LEKGRLGEVYNIGANTEKPNIEIVKLILNQVGKSDELIEYVKDRLGHDRRYAINSFKIKKELGWQPEYSFEDAIKSTVNWFVQKGIISGEYQNYYKLQYFSRS